MTREQTLPFRCALSYRLARPVWGLEILLGLTAILNAWLTLTTNDEGVSLAPFLSSTLRYLSHDADFWLVALVTLGIVKIVFAVGWLCAAQTPRSTAWLRGNLRVTGFSTFFWGCICTAILTSGQPPVVGMRYGLVLLTSVFCYLVLWDQLEREEMACCGSCDASGSDDEQGESVEPALVVREVEKTKSEYRQLMAAGRSGTKEQWRGRV